MFYCIYCRIINEYRNFTTKHKKRSHIINQEKNISIIFIGFLTIKSEMCIFENKSFQKHFG